MNVFIELAKRPTFTVNDVSQLVGNKKTAYSQLDRFMKKNLVKKIRNNIYSVVNPATGQLVANTYQIACAITDSAYLSHHSAFEYYGLTSQVFYEVYVSSETRFNNFSYDFISYKYIESRINEGVITAKNTTGVRVTDLERTVVDSIHDINKIGSLETIIGALEAINYLDETKLLNYLKRYNTQGLYQRVGFFLEPYKKEMHLSKDFFKYTHDKIGKSRSYLISEAKNNSVYDTRWKLMVPKSFVELKNHGGDSLV